MTWRLLKHRHPVSEAIHGALAAMALVAAFLLRFDFRLDPGYQRMLFEALPVLLVIKLAVFRAFGLRDLAWRYLAFSDLVRMALANAVASAAALALRLAIGGALPRSIYALDFLMCLTFHVGARAAVRMILDARREGPVNGAVHRVLVYGAGEAGVTLLGEIAAHPQLGYQVVGLLDDDPCKRLLRIRGVRVLGGKEELPAIAKAQRVEEVLVALPTASGHQIAAILEKCRAAHVSAKRVPALAELIEHRGLVDQIREVRLEDLLGRPPVRLDEHEIRARLAGRVVLVTGAAGSIGSELCRQISRYHPAALIGFDHAETALYQIDREIRERFPEVAFYPELGSIQNRRRMDEVFREHRPHSVYHAAAYKHVPMMEGHLFEAVENNVFGTRNVAQAAGKFGAEDFVLVSSDKAVRPANVMGTTKRLGELVCLASEVSGGRTRFMAVRFGNVLGSNGSVIPLFQRQIAAGGPLTVTHPGMHRYFMTVHEAAHLVLQAAAMGTGGEIFVLDMGPPVRILDLARNMILLSGLKPDADIHIEFSGVRPGEKLCEELNALEEHTVPTQRTQIRVLISPGIAPDTLARGLDDLHRCTEARDAASAVRCLRELVPDYTPSSLVLRRTFQDKPRAVAS